MTADPSGRVAQMRRQHCSTGLQYYRQGYRVTGSTTGRVTGLQAALQSGLQGYWATGSTTGRVQGYRATGSTTGRATGLQAALQAGLQGYWATGSTTGRVTGLQGCRQHYRQGHRVTGLQADVCMISGISQPAALILVLNSRVTVCLTCLPRRVLARIGDFYIFILFF